MWDRDIKSSIKTFGVTSGICSVTLLLHMPVTSLHAHSKALIPWWFVFTYFHSASMDLQYARNCRNSKHACKGINDKLLMKKKKKKVLGQVWEIIHEIFVFQNDYKLSWEHKRSLLFVRWISAIPERFSTNTYLKNRW